MIGFGMGGNVMGGPGNFGDPDDESARGAYVSGGEVEGTLFATHHLSYRKILLEFLNPANQ